MKRISQLFRKAPPEDHADLTKHLPRKTFPSGIKPLYSPDGGSVDIVFVHGLTGDRDRTWTAQDATEPWPKSLLPSILPTARILTFGYDASVTDWKGVVSQSRIGNHATNLLTSLASYRDEDGTNERPIVFICHSLGGLVCEDALVTSKQQPQPHLHNVLRSTHGIIFLGTPHHGAGLARWAELVSKSIGLVKQTNPNIVQVLRRDSEVLARIQHSFHTMIKARATEGQPSIEITCFYEELPLPGVGLVVPQDSAILPGYIPIGIRNDHMGMTKFASTDDPGFVAVCGELRRWIRAIEATERHHGNPPPPSNHHLDGQFSSASQYGNENHQHNNFSSGTQKNVKRDYYEAGGNQYFDSTVYNGPTHEDCPIDLFTVHEACYDSEDVQYKQGSPRCVSGTRVRIRERITQWADEDSAEPLFWLAGPAGTGKSTIARTIADTFASKERLVAGYFFKRGEQGRNDTNRLFSTIAMQLVDTIPHFKDCLWKSIDKLDKDAVEKKSLEKQFDLLLLGPLGNLPRSDTNQPTSVVIIDALDECERPEHLTRIVTLLSKLHNIATLRLRVIFTSRSTRNISNAFKPLLENKTACMLDLHRDFSEDSKTDIEIFLKAEFADIKEKSGIDQDPWPVIKDFNRLVQLATSPSPLFIYAATLCRFVYDGKHPSFPKDELKKWLDQCQDNKSQLHQIYSPILSQAFPGIAGAGSSQDLQFLGALVLLKTPLPTSSLASLLGIDADKVKWWLRELHAVLDIPAESQSPIRLLHKSFSDFLLSQGDAEPSDYQVDTAKTHAMLAAKCIKRMQSGLRRDICDIRKPDMSRDDINKQAIDNCIPVDLEYACVYWVYHLKRSERPIGNDVATFLYEHFLHWLEALSLCGRLSDSAVAIRELLKMMKGLSNTPSGLGDFAKDAIRVLSSFGAIVDRAPLQIYGALILFSPVASKVRQRFWNQRLPSLSRVQGVKSDWDAHRQTLEGHGGSVIAVAFSPDGQVVASASRDKTVRLWDAARGAHRQTLEGHGGSVNAVAFSPDGQVVASASYDGTVRLWDAATGAHRQTLEGHGGSVNAVAFSPDGQVVASASRDNKTVQLWDVRLWDAATGAHRQTIKGFTRNLSFDPLFSTRLFTDFGFVDLLTYSKAGGSPSPEETVLSPAIRGLGLNPDRTWIMKGNERVVWLPKEYRPSSSATRGSVMFIGCSSGRVIQIVDDVTLS